MIRGTTPTQIFNVPIDLREAKVYVTYSQKGQVILEKTNEDLEITEFDIRVILTQEDTLKFSTDVVFIQIRYVTSEGYAAASDIITVPVDGILKQGVISYGN